MTVVEQIYRDIEITFEIHDPVRMYFESRRGEWLEREKQQMEKMYNHAMFALVDGNGHGESFEEYFNNIFNK
jgi:hypothetical protein